MLKSKVQIKDHKRKNREMFNAIADNYDLINHILSGGIDFYWRWRALSKLSSIENSVILDLATGTGDFTIAARRFSPSRVVGVDVARAKIKMGTDKVSRCRFDARLLGGDAESLPFRCDTFDIVMAAFGVRNFGHIPTGLAEAFRVLRPGGQLIILDFCEPTLPIVRGLYLLYFRKVLPFLGGLISGERQAYEYLPRSVSDFPQDGAFLDLMSDAGFIENSATKLTLGICSIYLGEKN
ncbi:MAG: ubiquinone/menaquinone biosynthesis methyltransferase [Candidatus Latescibacterota bacterium]|nr:ubiquinone/menaquinone biosynthesis methyltransferase [Candidatus Latescibacterota bacterium]